MSYEFGVNVTGTRMEKSQFNYFLTLEVSCNPTLSLYHYSEQK